MRKPLGHPDLDTPVGMTAVTDHPVLSATGHIQTHIGDKLKALYAEVVNQPIPDHLLDLVSKLEAHSKGR